MAKRNRGIIGDLRVIIERSEKIGCISDKDKNVVYDILNSMSRYYKVSKKYTDVYVCFNDIIKIHDLLKRLWKLDAHIVECYRDIYSYTGNYNYHLAKVRTSWCSHADMPYLIPVGMVNQLEAILKNKYGVDLDINISAAICCRGYRTIQAIVGMDILEKEMSIELDAQIKSLLKDIA